MHSQNMPTFTHQKTFLDILFCLFLKSSKLFSVSLNVLREIYAIYILLYTRYLSTLSQENEAQSCAKN